MKRYFGIIITAAIVLIVLFALNAADTVTLDRPPEDEYLPIRSSYNPGPTGTRAFYQLLEESGHQIARWREPYKNLNIKNSSAQNAALVVIGPFPFATDYEAEESDQLRSWVEAGGKLLLVSRAPEKILRASNIVTNVTGKSYELKDNDPQQLVAAQNELLIAQPTPLTRNLRGLAISKLATRLSYTPPGTTKNIVSDTKAITEEDQGEGTTQTEAPSAPTLPPSPTPSPALNTADVVAAPVIHLGDAEGAVLLELTLGKGRVFVLSDPFVIANNGIAQGANLQLALNLVEALGGKNQKIFVDEYHHGYHSQGNALLNYFRGTPVPWALLQFVLVALLLAYSAGKRFARPLPMPIIDRHSPLEFVGSMASLQQTAQARDLALENIYPRFKHKVCRTLGLPPGAPPSTIVAALKRRSRVKESEVELLGVFSTSERALKGARLDDQRLIDLVAAMRRIGAQLK